MIHNSENQFSVVCEKSKHEVKDLRFNGLKVLMTLISGLRADIFATQGYRYRRGEEDQTMQRRGRCRRFDNF